MRRRQLHVKNMKKNYSLIIFFLIGLHLYANDSIQNDRKLKVESLIVKNTTSDSIVSDSTIVDSVVLESLINYYEFENDTVALDKPQNVGQIIYVEHTKDIDKILEYLFPIFMLLLGVIIDRCLLKINEKERIEKNGELWLIEIKALKGSLEKQISSLSEFIKTYCDKENEFDIPSIPKYESLKCDIFSSFSKKDLYDFLCIKNKKESVQIFHKINSIISTTKDTYEQQIQYFNRSMESMSVQIDSFDINLQNYRNELLLNESYANSLKDDYRTLMALLSSEVLEKMPKINIFELQKSFIEESLTIINKHNKEQCSNLLEILLEMQKIIQALKNEKYYLKSNFNSAIKMYKEVNTHIELLSNKYNI